MPVLPDKVRGMTETAMTRAKVKSMERIEKRSNTKNAVAWETHAHASKCTNTLAEPKQTINNCKSKGLKMF